ncbi:hypothetical protein AQS70_03650 [Pseudomonas endophytica]|uniref:Uncharacterized protein n=1 Tax=Pseudomonas endophytica TaxID=1563157 RepID=A0A0Q0YTR9_9PSED|nr:hypothetical protein AQS70_03650 [Pseudomonas endophytica]
MPFPTSFAEAPAQRNKSDAWAKAASKLTRGVPVNFDSFAWLQISAYCSRSERMEAFSHVVTIALLFPQRRFGKD